MSQEGTKARRHERTSHIAIGRVIQDVLIEFHLASSKHAPMNSAHEAYSVILEEVEEFWDEVKKKRSERSLPNMRSELIQIAAMAVRAICNLNLANNRKLLDPRNGSLIPPMNIDRSAGGDSGHVDTASSAKAARAKPARRGRASVGDDTKNVSPTGGAADSSNREGAKIAKGNA